MTSIAKYLECEAITLFQKRTTKLFTVLLLLLLGIGGPAQAQERHALIIGNSNYGSGFDLVNPLADTTAIAEKLSGIGYKVHKDSAQLDLNLEDFNVQLDQFLGSIEDGSSVLFYYAGHGAASGNVNYLIPILPEGVRLKTESDIRNRSISIESILERAHDSNPAGVNVFFIDACRDGPVERSSRSINLTGLAALDGRRQPRGSFIGFSTEYGQVAEDGEGDYSPFAAAVLNNLDQRANSPIELFYKGVSEEVYLATNGKQYPIQEPKIRGDYCLVPCEAISINPATKAPTSQIELSEATGRFDLTTTPANADICYQVEGKWDGWNCDQAVALPIGQPVSIKVSAKNFKTKVETLVLERPNQALLVDLEPRNRTALKVVGAVGAALIVGAMMSKSDSGPKDEPYSLTLTPPSR